MTTSQISRSSRTRRRVQRTIAVLGASAALVTVAGTHPASASTSLYGGTGSDSISCGAGGMYQDVLIRPQTGYSYSQTVGYQLYIHDLTTGTAGWTSWTTFPASSRIQGFTYPANHTYEIYVNYAWLRSTGWTTKGEWITSYGHRSNYGPFSYTRYCQEW